MSLAETIPLKLQAGIDNLIDNVTPSPWLNEAEKASYISKIKALLKEKNAVVIAHYYVDDELQALAEETGGYVSDSLDMANFGSRHSANTLVICGVRFMGETSREKFVRLAESRVNNLVKTMRLLGNLSNKSNYSYTERDVEKMFRTLERELKDAKARFAAGGASKKSDFKLD